MTSRVEFFFDVGSPASYLAWTQLPALCREAGAELVYRPMLLGGVFQATGNASPGAVPVKGRYTSLDLARHARRYGVPLSTNPHFPIITLMLMRGAAGIQLRQPERLQDYLRAVFQAIWVGALDLNQPALVARVLSAAGFDPTDVLALANDAEVKAALRNTTDEAVARNVFGAPTMFVGDEMFFGQDRLDFVREALHAHRVGPRPWHATYPAGMPHDAAIDPGATLPSLFAQSFDRFAALPAFACGDASISYAELDMRSRNFAAWLQAQGLRKGQRVALMLPNSLAYPVALAGTLRAGLVVVSVNPMYTARELATQLIDSGASALVTIDANLALVEQIRSEVPFLEHVVASDDSSAHGVTSLTDALAQGAQHAFVAPAIAASDTAFLQYTGGTTGVAKGAALSHANMVASAVQMLTWLDAVFEPGHCACVTPLPLYHIYPLNVAFLLMLRGGVNRLIGNPRDLDTVFAEFVRAPFSILIGVNTLFNGLLASGRLSRKDFAGTGTVIGAGATIQQSVAQRWNEATGVPIREGYGLTECSPCVAFNVLGGPEWTGSIGVPMPSTDVKLIAADGSTVAPGEAGELCVKGPQVFTGYWQRPEESACAFTPDGWFRTGDVATMDARGRFFIVDRLKDMILVSGFNVYPNEIEAVVAAMPGVLECACIGVPDERSGEAPHLFIVATDASLTVEQVLTHCRGDLTRYKVPRHISFVDALPKSAVGKILRKELRVQAAAATS